MLFAVGAARVRPNSTVTTTLAGQIVVEASSAACAPWGLAPADRGVAVLPVLLVTLLTRRTAAAAADPSAR